MILTPEEIEQVQEQNARTPDREVHGVVVDHGKGRRLVPLQNLAVERDRCRHNPAELRAIEQDGRTIQAYYHTHVRQSLEPSQADLVSCTASGLPWIIVGYPNRRQRLVKPCPGLELPLEGRPFCHGAVDCYTLIRDYYAQVLNIVLPDFAREDDWWLKGQDVYMENLEAAGFRPLPAERSNLRQHDVILIKIYAGVAKDGRPRVPNHGAIYLGASRIIHHRMNRLSCREFYAPSLQNRTACYARHHSLE